MLSVVDNIHWQLEDLEQQLKRCINDVNEKNIKIRHYCLDNRAYWFRQIVYYVSNGLTYREAVQLLCEEEKMEYSDIKKVFECFNYERKAMEMHAKTYAIKKMIAAKFTQTEISRVLGCSIATVKRLSKCNLKTD